MHESRTETTTPTSSPVPAQSQACALIRSGQRRVGAGLGVVVAAALAPVLGSRLDGAWATAAWLVSMPGCLAGMGVLAAGVMRWHRGAQAQPRS